MKKIDEVSDSTDLLFASIVSSATGPEKRSGCCGRFRC